VVRRRDTGGLLQAAKHAQGARPESGPIGRDEADLAEADLADSDLLADLLAGLLAG
jgi:hypothetical protein